MRGGVEPPQNKSPERGENIMPVILDFLKALAGVSSTKQLSPEFWRLEGNKATIKVDQVPELKRPGGAVYLSGKGLGTPVLVVRDDDGNYHGFSNRCSHFGRKLDPVPGKSVLRCCSVNHSTFNYSGANLTGPTTKPVKVYRTELKDGNLMIFV
jgi:cytochrome b6-f complex iron-sulfur subunit